MELWLKSREQHGHMRNKTFDGYLPGISMMYKAFGKMNKWMDKNEKETSQKYEAFKQQGTFSAVLSPCPVYAPSGYFCRVISPKIYCPFLLVALPIGVNPNLLTISLPSTVYNFGKKNFTAFTVELYIKTAKFKCIQLLFKPLLKRKKKKFYVSFIL